MVAAVSIVVLSVFNQSNKEQTFKENVIKSDSLLIYPLVFENSSDTTQIKNFAGQYVILNFWATWSDYSKNMHKRLAAINLTTSVEVIIIAASVRDADSQVKKHLNENTYPFHYVEGTGLYDKLSVPGVPSNIIIGPEGEILDVQVGYDDALTFKVLPLSSDEAGLN